VLCCVCVCVCVSVMYECDIKPWSEGISVMLDHQSCTCWISLLLSDFLSIVYIQYSKCLLLSRSVFASFSL